MKKDLWANLLDEMLLFGVSALLLIGFNAILNLCGYRIKEPGVFLTGFFFVINVLYFPIIQNGKYGTTIGKRILKLDDETDEEREARRVKKLEAKKEKKTENK
ncbi:MAG: hypothetical protein PUE01_01140 [Clostridiaceae bacterium]|nr:hypothetical protein [Clostridiaceae bacterium]